MLVAPTESSEISEFKNVENQKTQDMNNMNPGPQHTDAHGRGKK